MLFFSCKILLWSFLQSKILWWSTNDLVAIVLLAPSYRQKVKFTYALRSIIINRTPLNYCLPNIKMNSHKRYTYAHTYTRTYQVLLLLFVIGVLAVVLWHFRNWCFYFLIFKCYFIVKHTYHCCTYCVLNYDILSLWTCIIIIINLLLYTN